MEWNFVLHRGDELGIYLNPLADSAIRLAAEGLCRDLNLVFDIRAVINGDMELCKILILTEEERQAEAGVDLPDQEEADRSGSQTVLSLRKEEAGWSGDQTAPSFRKEETDRSGSQTVLPFLEKEAVREEASLALTCRQPDIWPDFSCLKDEKGQSIWEAFVCACQNGKLYLTGNGRRGVIYAVYTFCEQIGVSPWTFWADVPVRKKEEFTLRDGYHFFDFPSVQYRGIFLNDEEELEAWSIAHTRDKTIGPETYRHVFELILRLRGNYIWPAMHVNCFNGDPRNGALAHEMGVVVGTSHCDMLLRSNQNEWKPWVQKKGYEGIRYDYSIPGENRERLREYWRESVEQNRAYEVCYTVGMRGIHDSGFSASAIDGNPDWTEEEKEEEKVRLLEQIIRDQRGIIGEVTGKPAGDSLQIFVPYKEVLSLYDRGLKLPEDITLMWADDNFGYVRRYPDQAEQKRRGGNALYYHNSYWAHPGMSYLFANTIPMAQTGCELRKCYEQHIRKIWVLNTGALKPLEQDISYFLQCGWDAGKEHGADREPERFLETFVDRMFTGEIGAAAASLWREFTQTANVRKAEHLCGHVFSQTAYGDEAGRRLWKLKLLTEQAVRIEQGLPEDERDAFFEMFTMKIAAVFYKNAEFYYADRSALCVNQGRVQAADRCMERSAKMLEKQRYLLFYYNRLLQGGKWDRIVTPESFPPPPWAMYPDGKRALSCEAPELDVSVWGQEPGSPENETLTFEENGVRTKWIELFNRGCAEIPFQIDTNRCSACMTLPGKGCAAGQEHAASPGESCEDGSAREMSSEENCGGSRVYAASPGESCEDGSAREASSGKNCGGSRVYAASPGKSCEDGSACEVSFGKRGVVSSETRILITAANDIFEKMAAAGVRSREEELLIRDRSSGKQITVKIRYIRPSYGDGELRGYLEADGCVSMRAERYSRMLPDENAWRKTEGLGRMDGSVMEAVWTHWLPAGVNPGADNPAAPEPHEPERAIPNPAEGNEPSRKPAAPEPPTLEYEFTLHSSGCFLLEIDRYITLNSKGTLRFCAAADRGPEIMAESRITDEWRPGWKEAVLADGEKLMVQLPYLKAGCHRLRISALDPYLAFDRLIIYTGRRPDNQLAPRESRYASGSGKIAEAAFLRSGAAQKEDREVNSARRKENGEVRPAQSRDGKEAEPKQNRTELLPVWEDSDTDIPEVTAARRCRAPEDLLPPLVFAGKSFWQKDLLFTKNETEPQHPGKQKYFRDGRMPVDFREQFGTGYFLEEDGKICLEAEYAAAGTRDAYLIPDGFSGKNWELISSVTDGGTGFAMKSPGWSDREESKDGGAAAQKSASELEKDISAGGTAAQGRASLNYRIKFRQSGEYQIWFLMKFNDDQEDTCLLGLDDMVYPFSEQYSGGHPFTYSTSKVWFWELMETISVTEGLHTFRVLADKPNLRIDRIYITSGQENPPDDAGWKTTGRRED